MAKYKIVKEFSFIPQGVQGDNFIMNTPPPIILKIGDIIEGFEYTSPITNSKVLIYTYTIPPQTDKSVIIPMSNVVKNEVVDTNSNVKLSLTDKYKALHAAQKVGIMLAGVVVLIGVTLGILELRKKNKK